MKIRIYFLVYSLCLIFVNTSKYLINNILLGFSYLNISDYSTVDIKDIDLNTSEPEIADDLALSKNTQNQVRRAACMVLIRNSLNNGDERIKQTLKQTKLDKGLSFDKIILLMLENCNKQIHNEQVLQVLSPDTILSFDSEHLPLLNFTSSIFDDPFYQITFTAEENEILKEVNSVKFTEEPEQACTKDLSDYEKIKLIAIGASSTLALVLIFLVIKNLFNGRKEEENLSRTSNKKKK